MSMTCQKAVKSAGLWNTPIKCGKPVKADNLCGVHLAAKKRRDDGAAKRRAERAADAAAWAKAEEKIKALNALGWAARDGRRPGDVVIEDMDGVIAVLKKEEGS